MSDQHPPTERSGTDLVLHGVFNRNCVFIGVLTSDGVLVEVGAEALLAAGIEREQVINQPFAEAPSWRWSPAVQATIKEALLQAGGGKPVRFELVPKANGQQTGLVECLVAPAPDARGDGVRLIITMIDASDRRRTEQALRESLEDLNRAQAVAQTGSWRLDVRRNELRWSEETYRIFGVPPGAEMSYVKFLSLVHPDDREAVDRQWQEALNGTPYDIEHRIVVGRDVKWVRERAELEFDVTGELAGGFGTAQDITERKAAEEALRNSEERFRRAITLAPFPILLYAEDGRIIQVNRAWVDLSGYTEHEMGTIEAWAARAGGGHEAPVSNIDRLYSVNSRIDEGEHLIKTASGEQRIWHLSSAPLGVMEGVRLAMIMAVDVTDRKRAEEELRSSHDFANKMMANIGSAVFVMDSEGRFTQVNPAATALCGYSEQELLGRPYSMLVAGHVLQEVQEQFRRVLIEGETVKGFETQIVHRDGEPRTVLVNAAQFTLHRTAAVVCSLQDITARKKMEDHALHIAHHDHLTGLPNRRLLLDLISSSTYQARRRQKRLALLFLDLDRFKYINDTFGHEAGDQLLVQVAQRLKGIVRRSDMVARIGGDEFNVLLSDIEHGESAAEVAQQIVDSFDKPFVVGGQSQSISTSIGISIFPDDGEDVESLLARADLAMYAAKQRGRDTYCFFDPRMQVRAIERTNIENELRQALERGELQLYYQPQVHLHSKKIIAVEALLRWRHPRHGLLAPADFMPIAEESGICVAIEHWVLTEACSQLREWQRGGAGGIRVAVNLCDRHLHAPDLIDRIRHALDATRLNPGCLELEVSEVAVMNDIEPTANQLRLVADTGVHVAVDHFGTVCSSLRWLQRLPITRVKIDPAFIQDIAIDSNGLTVVQAVIGLSHSLGMRVVAEGVETGEQLSLLAAQGCDEVQGYLTGRPMPASEIAGVLRF